MIRGDLEWEDDAGAAGNSVMLPLLGQVAFDVETVLDRTDKCLWPCALLLCEWVLRARRPECDAVVELGCGVGLVARCARLALGKKVRVIATDAHLNERLSANVEGLGVEQVELEWSDAEAAVRLVNSAGQRVVLLGSDLIYDDDATTMLVALLERVFEESSASELQAVLAVEKRIVWVAGDEAPSAPYHAFFEDLITHASFAAQQLDVSAVEHVLPYRRTNQMQLWLLTRRLC